MKKLLDSHGVEIVLQKIKYNCRNLSYEECALKACNGCHFSKDEKCELSGTKLGDKLPLCSGHRSFSIFVKKET